MKDDRINVKTNSLPFSVANDSTDEIDWKKLEATIQKGIDSYDPKTNKSLYKVKEMFEKKKHKTNF